MYALIGRFLVKTVLLYVRRRYGRSITIGTGVVAVGLGIAAYLASRDVPEG